MSSRAARILIVDDEPFNVDLLEQLLDSPEFSTTSAGDGGAALERVAESPPDIILLDVMMPVMDGFEVCRQLKSGENTRLIPVIIMTALNDIDDRVKGIEAGADDFLSKPVDERELLARIRTALKSKWAIDSKLETLASARDHFSKFVPEPVRRRIAENPDAPDLEKREQDITVLFLDVSEYSRLSETIAGAELNDLMEAYFSRFLDIVQKVDGDINETAGDGFMAIFPEAHTAADAALDMVAAAKTLNAQREGEPLLVHIGINSGTALVGSTRIVGSRNERWTFTASGPVTNLAARLADFATPGAVYAGPETVDRLGSQFAFESLGPVQLKNLSDMIIVHRLSGRL